MPIDIDSLIEQFKGENPPLRNEGKALGTQWRKEQESDGGQIKTAEDAMAAARREYFVAIKKYKDSLRELNHKQKELSKTINHAYHLNPPVNFIEISPKESLMAVTHNQVVDPEIVLRHLPNEVE